MTKAQKFYLFAFTLALALVPVLAIIVPRVLAYIPAGVGLLGFFTYGFVFKERAQRYLPAFIIVGVLSALMFLSSLWALDPEVSLERAQKTMPLLVCGAFLISAAFSIRITALEPYLRWLPYILFAAAGLCCLEIGFNYPVYRLVRGDDFNVQVGLAVFNRAAVTIVLLTVPSLVIMRHYHSAQICIMAVLFTIIPMLLMGESQSAQLGLLVAGLAFALFPYKWRFAYPLSALVIGALMLAMPFLSMWAFQNYAASLNATPIVGQGGGFAGARLEIWDYVSRYIMQNPLYGYGVEGTKQVSHFGSGEIFQQGQTILHPHNYALQIWMEFGLAGIVLAAVAIGYLIMQAARMPARHARVVLPVLLWLHSPMVSGRGGGWGCCLSLPFIIFSRCG